jgi:poly(beta-D-mannuronate) lyase
MFFSRLPVIFFPRPFLKRFLVCALMWSLEVYPADYAARSAAELESLMAKVGPGDFVILQNGKWKSQYLRFFGRGKPGRPITLKAETQGKVILTGQSRLDISGQWLVVDGLHFEDGFLGEGQHVIRFTGQHGDATDSKLTNTSIINYSPPDKSTRYFWVSLYGQRNRLDHNRFQGHNHSGVTVAVHRNSDKLDEHIIEFNHFLDREPGRGNGFETIRVGTGPHSGSNSKTLIQHNLFERTNGELETISLKSSENMVCCNTFKQVSGSITLRQGYRNKIIGNYFLGEGLAGTGGIRVTGEGHLIANNLLQELGGRQGGGIVLICGNDPEIIGAYKRVVNLVIAHNTLIDIRGSLIKFDGGCGKNRQEKIPQGISLINNLLVNTVGALYVGKEGQSWVWDANRTCINEASESKCVEKFKITKDGDGVWRPSKGGSLIESGMVTECVGCDDRGNLCVRRFDVGAHEFSGLPIPHGPLTADEVGPQAQIRP